MHFIIIFWMTREREKENEEVIGVTGYQSRLSMIFTRELNHLDGRLVKKLFLTMDDDQINRSELTVDVHRKRSDQYEQQEEQENSNQF